MQLVLVEDLDLESGLARQLDGPVGDDPRGQVRRRGVGQLAGYRAAADATVMPRPAPRSTGRGTLLGRDERECCATRWRSTCRS